MPRPDRIDDVYSYALSLADLHRSEATAIGVAATVTPKGPRALAGACQIFDEDGQPYTRQRILDLFSETAGLRYLVEQTDRGIDYPGGLRYMLAIAAIRAVAVMRSELDLTLELGELD